MNSANSSLHSNQAPAVCRRCLVRYGGICAALDDARLAAFANQARISRHGAGETLLSEGGPADCCANVRRGAVALTQKRADGRRQFLGQHVAPDFIGRLDADDGATRIEAITDVELCRFSRAALLAAMAENPALERRLLDQALRDTEQAREWMRTLGAKTAGEKVARFLLALADQIHPRAGSERAGRLALPMARSEIADFLGLTIGTISRELSRLRRKAVIEINGHREVTVIDRAALRVLAG